MIKYKKKKKRGRWHFFVEIFNGYVCVNVYSVFMKGKQRFQQGASGRLFLQEELSGAHLQA